MLVMSRRIEIGFIAIIGMVLSIAVAHKVAMDLSNFKNSDCVRVPLSSLVGQYSAGDRCGYNVSLRIKRDGTYTRVERGCEGGVEERGAIKMSESGRLILKQRTKTKFHFLNKEVQVEATGESLMCPVSWGERMYLISANIELARFAKAAAEKINTSDFNDYISFCDEVNAGEEPRMSTMTTSRALLRVGDEKGKVRGQPELPSKWLPYLLKKPIRGHLLKLFDCPTKTNYMRGKGLIDLGSADGVMFGTTLFLCKKGTQPEFPASISVLNVEEHSSLIEWTVYDGFDQTLPFVGQTVVSKRPEF